jgi:O-antigen/teichoic acid export membrane protein
MQLKTARGVLKGTFFLTAGELLNKLGALFFCSVLARKMGPEEFGTFSLALVLAMMVMPVTDLGLPQMIYRDGAGARDRAAALAGSGILLRAISLPAAVGALVLLFVGFRYDQDLFSTVLLVGVGVLTVSVSLVFHSLFRAIGNTHLEAVSFMIRLPLLGALTLWTLAADLDLASVARMYLVYSVLAAAGAALVARSANLTPNWPEAKETIRLLRRSAPLGLQSAMVNVYQLTSSIVLSRTHGIVSVGFYQAACRLTTSLNILGKSFTAATLPYLVRVDGKSDLGLERAYYRTVKYLLGLGLPIAAGTTVLAPGIIALFYGAQFEESVLPLQILIWAEVLVFWGFAASSVLLARDRRWELSVQAAVGGGFNVIASLVCVVRWGEPGAAIAALASEVVAVATFTFLLNHNGIRLPRRLIADVVASLGACVLMVLVLRATGGWPLVPQIVLGAGVYAVTLLIFRFLDKDEVQTARLMLRASAPGV